ncbi:hypothetical protein [Cytophaga aurantiaca]|uniref:hypothetical protein n=1 Tax=Cytophaga aurantiaca TaxID=29530 RepID=UPI0003787FD5|nr:hypothetical protein [Cytophaga aurantiaca]
MKNKSFLITILASIAVMAVMFGFTNKAKSNGGILTMRTSEVMNGLWDNSITIVDEEGKVEKIELKKLKMGDLSQNLIIINENLNKIKSKGYKLILSAEGGSEGLIMTTYTFEKE